MLQLGKIGQKLSWKLKHVGKNTNRTEGDDEKERKRFRHLRNEKKLDDQERPRSSKK